MKRLLLIFILAAAPAFAQTGNLWVGASGTCTRVGTPATYNAATSCSSFQAAQTAATGGDTVMVLNGTYSAQNLTSGAKSTTVNFIAQTTGSVIVGGGGLTINIDKVRLFGIVGGAASLGTNRPGLDIEDLTNTAFTDVVVNCGNPIGGTSTLGWKNFFAAGSFITVTQCDIGNWNACDGYSPTGPTCTGNCAIEDATRFWSWGIGSALQPNNDTLSNDVVHDVSAPPDGACGGGAGVPHVDALQVFSGGSNMVINANKFYGNASSALQSGGGTLSNWTVTNNYFGETTCCNNLVWGQASVSGSFTVKNNTNANPNGYMVVNNASASGAATYDYSSNLNIAAPTVCTATGSVTGAFNVFPSSGGTTCGTNTKRCTPTFLHGVPAAGNNYDVSLDPSDTCAKAAGNVSDFATPDIIGTVRPQSARIDAGAFELSGTPTVATPVASPVAGTYAGTQTITLTSSTSGAAICYTVDGSTPTATTPGTCSHGTTYSSGFTVTLGTTTVNAIGTLTGDTNSSLLTASYVITGVTWYIRPDGGTATQCVGTTNAAYPGSGSAQACALKHPYWMINSAGNGWTHMVAGDTVQFINTTGTSDTYLTGEQNAGIGTDWNANGLSSICPTPNPGQANGASCIMPAPPNNTTWLGQNAGNCHDSAHSHLINPTILSGIGGAFAVLDTRSTTGVTYSCIEVTQPDTCTVVGNGTGMCGNFSNYVHFGGLIMNYLTGPGPTSLTLTDFAAVGIGSQGILGSNLRGTTTLTDVYIIGNGGEGWNADGGGCNTSCEDTGTINEHYNIYAWNGCEAINYDMTKSFQQNSYNYCMAQTTGNFASGDGQVMIAAGNVTLNVDHSQFQNNVQDGFDALHLSDDLSTSPAIHINTSIAAHNLGQTFKVGAGTASSAINNISVQDCRAMTVDANYPLNPSGWSNGNTNVADQCRAQGEAWVFGVKAGAAVTMQNNTTIGYGTTTYTVLCGGSSTTCISTGAATMLFQNNTTYALPDPGNSGQFASGFFFQNGDIFANSGSLMNFNNWYQMRTGCPNSTTPEETNQVCGNPGFNSVAVSTDGTLITVNPNITSGSLLAAAGTHIAGITTDFNGNAVTNPPAIGAFTPTGTTTVATPTASPVAGTYSSTQTVTLSTATSGATICYTTDGTTPAATTPGTCSHGTTYISAISVSTSQTIMAIGTLSGDTNSSVLSAVYVIAPLVSTPTASPAAGTYFAAQTVTLTTSTSGATICYTVDGSTPTATTAGTCTHGTTYSSTISVAATQTIKALGTKSGDTNSSVASFAYTINLPATVATPTATPSSGTYTSTQSVTLSTATSGASICYTTDGTTPTATTPGTCSHGTTYSSAISVPTTQTILALGTKSADVNSSVASFGYTITSATSVTFGGSIGFGAKTGH